METNMEVTIVWGSGLGLYGVICGYWERTWKLL